jgi:AcrR family transcriptional regulator
MADGATAAPCADPDIGTQAPRQRRTRGPSLDKTAQTRQQIAEAALAEFVECGVARSTMERIACRAQVAKGTLYLYYPSKDELLRGVVEHALRHSAVYQPLRRRKGRDGARLSAPQCCRRWRPWTAASAACWHAWCSARHGMRPSWPDCTKSWLLMPGRTMCRTAGAGREEGELKTRSVSRSAQLLASPFWMALVHNNLLASEGSQKLALKPLVELLIDNLFAARRVTMRLSNVSESQ